LKILRKILEWKRVAWLLLATTVLLLIASNLYFLSKNPSDKTIITGPLELSEGAQVQNVLVYHFVPADSQNYSPAVDTRGAARVQNLYIYSSGIGVRASSSPNDKGAPVSFAFSDNTIVGPGNIGLILDVRPEHPLELRDNTFVGQRCGIDISIDVVFSQLDIDKRLSAWREYAEQLEQHNRFIAVVDPICGSRG